MAALEKGKGVVTPFAGVWIEIGSFDYNTAIRGSPPSRGCGLKLDMLPTAYWVDGSPPSRGCGLKFKEIIARLNRYRVTPFAGVWIEIKSEKVGRYGI